MHGRNRRRWPTSLQRSRRKNVRAESEFSRRATCTALRWPYVFITTGCGLRGVGHPLLAPAAACSRRIRRSHRRRWRSASRRSSAYPSPKSPGPRRRRRSTPSRPTKRRGSARRSCPSRSRWPPSSSTPANLGIGDSMRSGEGLGMPGRQPRSASSCTRFAARDHPSGCVFQISPLAGRGRRSGRSAEECGRPTPRLSWGAPRSRPGSCGSSREVR